MKIIVQKFGGTSVSSPEKRKFVILKIKKAIDDGYFPVIVVSAMGRKGQYYSTDTLLSLIEAKFKDENKLAADLIACCGEIISATVLCNELYKAGLTAVPLTGGQAGIITNDEFSQAEVIETKMDRVIKILNEGKIPIITGFQGETRERYFTTLGRGGSDTSASIIGVALKAEKIEIYTDVDGIMTADPRIVENAALIKQINYEDVFQFAYQGAKVIHPNAIKIAMISDIPLIIKNTMSDCDGTIISKNVPLHYSKIITGITYVKDRVQIRIDINENKENGYYYNVLELLALNHISIDLINVFPESNIFTIDNDDFEKLSNLLQQFSVKYNYIDKCCKISLIGSKMKGTPGVMARITKVLRKNNISILQTADSHSTIWCLVRYSDAFKAIKLLHDEFQMNKVSENK